MSNTIILDGREIAKKIKKELALSLDKMEKKPGLGIIMVGLREDSRIYVNLKKKECEKLGIRNYDIELAENVSQEEIIQEINKMNNDEIIDAILVQLPLPEHINEREVINSISFEKDVEGFHNMNVGRLTANFNYIAPCTPEGCIKLLKEYNIELEGKHVVVIGKSNVVGLPLALLCLHENATLTICHIYTKNLKSHTKQADILIVACGKPNLITADHIKEGCVIIDIGINKIEAPDSAKGFKIVGDVSYEEVIGKAGAITPVPGGVGPMTIAMLMKNTILLAQK